MHQCIYVCCALPWAAREGWLINLINIIIIISGSLAIRNGAFYLVNGSEVPNFLGATGIFGILTRTGDAGTFRTGVCGNRDAPAKTTPRLSRRTESCLFASDRVGSGQASLAQISCHFPLPIPPTQRPCRSVWMAGTIFKWPTIAAATTPSAAFLPDLKGQL